MRQYIVYIDESGDEGFEFESENKSSDWFLLSCIIFNKIESSKIDDCFKKILHKFGKHEKTYLHFRDLSNENKLFYIQELVKLDFHVITVSVYKPLLDVSRVREEFLDWHGPGPLNERTLFYYTFAYLLDGLTNYMETYWYHYNIDKDNQKFYVIIADRGGLEKEKIYSFLDKLKNKKRDPLDPQINWSLIKQTDSDQFEIKKASGYRGIQIADAVVSSFYYAFLPLDDKFRTEDYVNLISPKVIFSKKQIERGLIFFPNLEEYINGLIEDSELTKRLAWIRNYFR